jgi:lipid-A-disaccharide synthase
LRVVLSCAEASGELHAAGVAKQLARLAREAGAPPPELSGLGGRLLEDAGVKILGDSVSRAVMGLSGVLHRLPELLAQVERLARHFRDEQPDLFLPVDSPALHVPLARIARRLGVPVLHFVTPQYWGWAPWRVGGYRRAVDRALTILPFEPSWFERHGVDARHVGHPLVDRLPVRDERRARESSNTLAILPGSRSAVVERNLPWMLRRAATLAARVPGLDVAVFQASDHLAERLRGHIAQSPVEARLEIGDLHGGLAGARAALSVSGTILIDLLHQRLPTVVVYRVEHQREVWMARHLLTLPWFASPNLLAGEEVLPEFCFRGEGPVAAIDAALWRCFEDEGPRSRLRTGLVRAARRLGPAGASERAARHALELAAGNGRAGGHEKGRS